MSSSNVSSPARLTKTNRAPAACINCHARKVRCNVIVAGQPCANCQQDGRECILHVSERGRQKAARRRRPLVEAIRHTTSSLHDPPIILGISNSLVITNETSDYPQPLQLLTPTEEMTMAVEESESNIAGYTNIIRDSTADADQSKTHIYVGMRHWLPRKNPYL